MSLSLRQVLSLFFICTTNKLYLVKLNDKNNIETRMSILNFMKENFLTAITCMAFFLATAPHSLATAIAKQDARSLILKQDAKTLAVWDYMGSEGEKTLSAEHKFLLQFYAECDYANLRHVWNPCHDMVIFWVAPPPSGAIWFNFWVYKKVNGQFEFVNKYAYSGRTESRRDLPISGQIQNIIFEKDGFSFICPTGEDDESFTKKIKY